MAENNGSKTKDWTTRAEPVPGEEPKRFSGKWNWDMLVKFCVFGVTGSSTMFFARPLVTDLFGIHGSMLGGPWDYRIVSFLAITPIYSAILLSVASLAGRRTYFTTVVMRMWGRLLPKSVVNRLLKGTAQVSKTKGKGL
jgi:hypothetical protein